MRLCPLSRRHEFPFTLMLKREDLPPPNLLALSSFSSQNSGDFRRHVVFNPARILCVAGYFRCIGNSFPGLVTLVKYGRLSKVTRYISPSLGPLGARYLRVRFLMAVRTTFSPGHRSNTRGFLSVQQEGHVGNRHRGHKKMDGLLPTNL